MNQEDKGLVMRGILLLLLIGGLTALVLTILFRQEDSIDGAIESKTAKAPSAPGWDIRYNAATTLARRGSAAVPWHLIQEMLDEQQQLGNFRDQQTDGTVRYDVVTANSYVLSALKALAVWHEKRKAAARTEVSDALRAIYGQVDRLTESPIEAVKAQAKKTQSMLFR